MGVFVDYALRAEGTEDDVRARLERVRQRCLDLPLRSVGDVLRVEPIYNSINVKLLRKEGYVLPEAIAGRIRGAEADVNYGLRCYAFGLFAGRLLSESDLKRFLAAPDELIESTDLWRKEDLPEELSQSAGGRKHYTINRAAIEFELASILLCRGFSLIVHPGEGSETVNLGLATFGLPQKSKSHEPPLWYGESFTKTQYARDFVRAHENVCQVLDVLQEEGLLLQAGDTCGYYATRSWAEAGDKVNAELQFARAAYALVDVGIGNLREAGVNVRVLSDNASTARPVDFSEALEREKKKKTPPK